MSSSSTITAAATLMNEQHQPQPQSQSLDDEHGVSSPFIWEAPKEDENPYLVAEVEMPDEKEEAQQPMIVSAKEVHVAIDVPVPNNTTATTSTSAAVARNPFDKDDDNGDNHHRRRHHHHHHHHHSTKNSRQTKTDGEGNPNNSNSDEDYDSNSTSSSAGSNSSHSEHEMLISKEIKRSRRISKSQRGSQRRFGGSTRSLLQKALKQTFQSKSKIHNTNNKLQDEIMGETDDNDEKKAAELEEEQNQQTKQQEHRDQPSSPFQEEGGETVVTSKENHKNVIHGSLLGSESKKSFKQHISSKTTSNKSPSSSPPLTPVRAHGLVKAASILKREVQEAIISASPTCVKKANDSSLFQHSSNNNRSSSTLNKSPSTTTKTKNLHDNSLLPPSMVMLTPPPPIMGASMKRSESNGIQNPYAQQGAHHLTARCSELEPSNHQLQLPKCDDVLFHARICHVMECYQQLMEEDNHISSINNNMNFNFQNFVGKSRNELEEWYNQLTKEGRAVDMSHVATAEGNNVLCPPQPHPKLLKSLLDCAIDLTVAGYFVNDHAGVEVAVFSSEQHRQFIVCYRGSSTKQQTPINMSGVGGAAEDEEDESSSSNNCALYPSDHPIPIYGTFRDAYFDQENIIETQVFSLLNHKMADSPFCDIVFTGHSFGGALATIGSVRFAEQHPFGTTGITCHVFGCPKVSCGNEFRQLVHSLGNLNIVRIEYGKDPFVYFPTNGYTTTTTTTTTSWTHVGHTIRLQSMPMIEMEQPSSNKSLDEKFNILAHDPSSGGSTSTAAAYAKAFKFDQHREEDHDETMTQRQVLRSMSSTSRVLLMTFGNTNKKQQQAMKHDHKLDCYIKAIERFVLGHSPWMDHFEGQIGNGITTMVSDIKPAGILAGVHKDIVIMKEEERVVV